MSDQNTPKYLDGSISEIAQNVYEGLITTGYSLLYSDIEVVIIDAVKDYVSWGGEIRSLNDTETDDIVLLQVDGDTLLGVDEWSIIKPVVTAHCEVIQSKRMEGSQNLGVQPVGIASGEAKQLYKEAVEQMKKEAFDSEPYTVTLDEAVTSTTTNNNTVSLSNLSRFWWW